VSRFGDREECFEEIEGTNDETNKVLGREPGVLLGCWSAPILDVVQKKHSILTKISTLCNRRVAVNKSPLPKKNELKREAGESCGGKGKRKANIPVFKGTLRERNNFLNEGAELWGCTAIWENN